MGLTTASPVTSETNAPTLGSYPSQDEAKYAIENGLGYGTGNEPYIEAKVANTKTGGLLRDLGDMINSPSVSKDLTKLSNIGDRAKIATMYAQASLAANRSAIATFGFDPSRTDLSTNLGPLTVAGAYDPETDRMWMNVVGERAPSTVVHESIHRGLNKLTQQSEEAKTLLKKLPNEEYVVRYMMATKMGNPEEGTGELADKQRKSALSMFGLDSKYGKYVERLEEIAAELHKDQRPRGPR